MSQYSDLICFTVFAPNFDGEGAPLPITDYSIRNAHGVTAPPDTVAVGHYRITCPDKIDQKRISITARAFQNSVEFFNVLVISSDFAPGGTRFDIYVFDDTITLSQDFAYCEVTVRLLPIA